MGSNCDFFIVSVFVLYKINLPIDEKSIVNSLQERVIPYIQNNKITFYVDADWCKAIVYASSSAAEVPNSNDKGSCLKGALDFSSTNESVFNKLKNKLNLISGEKFRKIDTERPIIYRPEHAGYPYESIGIAFHVDCSFCNVRYVYWPQYKELPQDIEGEIKYIPINDNWYKVEQDWN